MSTCCTLPVLWSYEEKISRLNKHFPLAVFVLIPASVAIYKQMLHAWEKKKEISKCVVKKLTVFLRRQHAAMWQITSDCTAIKRCTSYRQPQNFSLQQHACTLSSCFLTTAQLSLVLFMPVYFLADGSTTLTNFAASLLTQERQQAEWGSLSICCQVQDCTSRCGRSHVLGLHHKD